VLRFADADVLTYAFVPSAKTIAGYNTELKKLLDDERTSTAKRDALIADGLFVAATDPRLTYVPPTPLPAVPSLNFATLDAAVAAVTASAQRYHAASTAANGTNASPALDAALIASEKALLGSGLPRRPWYRHELYAPGYFTGYGVKTMPAIREAIEERDWPGAQAGIASVSAAFVGANVPAAKQLRCSRESITPSRRDLQVPHAIRL